MQFETAVAIGEGAMGEVYKAYAPELGAHVAIKVLKRNDPQMVERLRREAAAMRRIDHPNVCKIIDIGYADERHYVAMQYVDGARLDQIGASLTIEQRVRLMLEICDAVAAAHAQGLIHRDLKPANILVEILADASLKPWVMDFGLVKDSQASTMTVAGQILGTPNYMAPEQARGEVQIDRRTDVYALGAVLYYLLTQHHPFDAESASEVLAQLLSERIPSPRARNPTVPAQLAAICLKAMERRADDRYPSATALAEDIERYLQGKLVQARSINLWYHLRHRWQDHRWPIFLGAILVSVALAASGVAIHNRWQLASATEAAAQFSAVVERNAQMLRLAQMAPGTDLADYRARVAADFQQIAAQAGKLEVHGKAGANAALGRLQLQLGDAQAAIGYLDAAWADGDRRSQTALALGLAYAEQLRLAKADLALQRDAQLRLQLAAAADEQWRTPALNYLNQTDAGGMEDPELGRALIAQLGADHEAAREHAERALSTAPWLFEAPLLIGRGYAEQAQEADWNGDMPATRALWQQATSAFDAAIAIAPSAAEALGERCNAALLQVRFRAQVDFLDPTEQIVALEGHCKRAIAADRESARPVSSIGHAHAMRARLLFLQGGGDPLEEFEIAETWLNQALAVQPENIYVLQQMVSMLRMRSFFESDRSVDPEPWVRRGLEHVDQLIELNPNIYSHYNSRGNLLLDLVIFQRDYGKDTRPLIAEAIAQFDAGLALRADQPAVVMNRAVGYSLLAEEEMLFDDQPGAAVAAFEHALESFDRALAIDPDDWDIPKNRAMLSSEYARYLLLNDGDPRPLLDDAIEALTTGLQSHPDDLTAMLALAGSYKYYAQVEFRDGQPDQDRIALGLAVVKRGMALDSGRYVDLANHGLGLYEQSILRSASPAAAAHVLAEALAMARLGLAKQAEPDPDSLMAAAQLVLLAQDLGLQVSAQTQRELQQWLLKMQTLVKDDPRLLDLQAWQQALRGERPTRSQVKTLPLPGRVTVAAQHQDAADIEVLERALAALPASSWWQQPARQRLARAP